MSGSFPHTDDLQNMGPPAAGGRDVHLTISAINPRQSSGRWTSSAVHRLWKEVYHIPGEESDFLLIGNDEKPELQGHPIKRHYLYVPDPCKYMIKSILIMITGLFFAAFGLIPGSLAEENQSISDLTYLTENCSPYNYIDNNTLKGISIDLLNEIFNETGEKFKADKVNIGLWNQQYNRTLNESETVLFLTAKSPQRESLFKWAGPVVKSRPQVIFSKLSPGKGTKKLFNLSGMKVGAIKDDIAAQDLITNGVVDIVYRPDVKTLIEELEAGSIDGFAYAEIPSNKYIQQYAMDPGTIQPVYMLSIWDYYYAFNKNTPNKLVSLFQDTIDKIKSEPDEMGLTRYIRIIYRYEEPLFAESNITSAQVTDLVNLTSEALAKNADKTIQDINSGMHPYHDRNYPELYVFVYDMDLKIVARADNPYMVGHNFKGMTDVAGTPFRDEILEGAVNNGTGWQKYIYSNPVEPGLFWKKTAYKLVTGSDGKQYIACAGMYLTRDSSS